MKARDILLIAITAFTMLCGCGPVGIPGFDWSVTPNRRTIALGDQATFTIRVKSKVNINAGVTLRLEGVPAGATASFSVNPMPDTAEESTLTIQTTGSTPEGTHSINVFAQENGQSEVGPITVLLIVTSSGGSADFSLEVDPADFTFTDGLSPTITFYVRPLNGFTGTVDISITGLTPEVSVAQGPAPPSLTFNPGDGGQGGTFVLRMSELAFGHPPVTITVRAASGALVHTRDVTVRFPGA